MESSAPRWFGVGRSELSDPAKAGLVAAGEAVDGRTPSLVVIFASLSHSVPEMAEAVYAEAGGNVPLIGCSSAGEFAGDGRGAGVVVLAFGGPGFDIGVRAIPQGTMPLREAGATAAGALDDVDGEHRLMLLLSDGRSDEQQEAVRGAYAVLGAGVPLVGACAADGMTQTSTRHFYSDGSGTGVQVLTNAVLGAAIGSDAPFGLGIAHGWVKIGKPMVVTRSEGGKIYELDGERAVDVYLRNSGASQELALDPAAFLGFAAGHPLGLSRRSGEDLRVIFAADPDEGYLLGLTDTPEDALVWLMQPEPAALRGAAATASTAAVRELGERDPLGLIVFDCCVRTLVLGPDGTDAAGADLRAALGDVPYGGFYSNGEILRNSGAKGMHHLTVVALAVG